ncbi:unnamed protein product [Aphanomyces euteiches]
MDASANQDSSGHEIALSLEQLKSNLFQTFQRDGAVEQIRVHLRTSFVQKLQKTYSPAVEAPREWTLLEKIANSMVCQYLNAKQLKHTLSVFVPEVGQANVPNDMIEKILYASNPPASPSSLWLIDLLEATERRATLMTHDIQTQTIEDDRRFVLENELKRIEDIYLSQSTLQKEQSLRSLEERMIQFQQEYDARHRDQFQKELERMREMEISMMRVEERKKYVKETEALRVELQSEYTAKAQALQDAETLLRTEHLERKTALEADIFELRQTLLRELEHVRAKERQLLSTAELESIKHSNEARRLALLEDNLKLRERQVEETIKAVQAERETQLERVVKEAEARVQEQKRTLQELSDQLNREGQQLKQSQAEYTAIAQRLAHVDAQLTAAKSQQMEQDLKIEELDHEKNMLRSQLQTHLTQLLQAKGDRDEATAALAHAEQVVVRLEREAAALNAIHEKRLHEKEKQVIELQNQLQAAREELVNIKLTGADMLVAVKREMLETMEAERRAAQLHEQNIQMQLFALQTKCSELEATSNRYRAELEDEQVHVASLRHEISSLNGVVNTFKYATDLRKPAFDRPSLTAHRTSTSQQDLLLLQQFDEWKRSQTQQNNPRNHIDNNSSTDEAQETQRLRQSEREATQRRLEEEREHLRQQQEEFKAQIEEKRRVDAMERVAREEKQRAEAIERAAWEEKLRAEANERAEIEAKKLAAIEAERKAQADAKNAILKRLQEENAAREVQEAIARQQAIEKAERERAERLAREAAEKKKWEEDMQVEMARKSQTAREEQERQEKQLKEQELTKKLAQKATEEASRSAEEAEEAAQVTATMQLEVADADDESFSSEDGANQESLESDKNTQEISKQENKVDIESTLRQQEMEQAERKRRQEDEEAEAVQLQQQKERKEAENVENIRRQEEEEDKARELQRQQAEREAEAARLQQEEERRQEDAEKARQEEIAQRVREEQEQAERVRQQQEEEERRRKADEEEEKARLQKEEEDRLRLQHQEAEALRLAAEEAKRLTEAEEKAQAEERAKREEEERMKAAQDEKARQEEEQKKKDSDIMASYLERAKARRAAEKLRLEEEAKAKAAEEAAKAAQVALQAQRAAAEALAEEEVKSESGESVISVGGVGNESASSADSF